MPTHVLLLEDNEADARMVSLSLRSEFSVTHVFTLGDALESLKEEEFDVIVSDLHVPDSEGLATVHGLRKAAPELPVVVLSGESDEELAIESVRAGAQDYVPKGDVAQLKQLPRVLRYAIERMGLMRELRAAKAQADEASRAKTLFLATMSHEIRTPMNGVLGAAQLLEMSTLDDEQRQLVQALNGSSRGLLAMLNDILDLSKVEAGELSLQPLCSSPSGLIEECVGTFRAAAEQRGIQLKGRTAGCDLQVSLDPIRFKQIILNLLGNALKFTEVGSVEVCLQELVQAENKVALSIEVRDTGPGIPEEQRAAIFERFSQIGTAKSRSAGTGLGLAICEQLVRLMGGEIGVRSAPGGGSCFWFQITMPLANPRSSASNASGSARPREGLEVLVVDDNAVNRLIVGCMLQRLGCEVAYAEDGKEALGVADSQGVDLILMDRWMPRLDGIEATALLREKGEQVPIIGLSASALATERQECLDAGMNDFLAKPLLFEALSALLARWTSVAC